MPIAIKELIKHGPGELTVDDLMAVCSYCQTAYNAADWRALYPYRAFEGRQYLVRLDDRPL